MFNSLVAFNPIRLGKLFLNILVMTGFVFLLVEGVQAYRKGQFKKGAIFLGQTLLVGFSFCLIQETPKLTVGGAKISYSALIAVLLIWFAASPALFKMINKLFPGRNDKNFNNEGYIGYFLIAMNTFLLYLISIRYSYLYHESHVPRGDPFTYSMGFFMLLDQAHVYYWNVLISIFLMDNWYWLINFMIALFSPILIKEPYSIAMVNFILFGLAGASIFRLSRCLNYTITKSFLLSLIPWIFPSNYGFHGPVALLQMQLDTAFLFAVVIAVSNTIIYAMDIGKTKNAFWAGISIGVAIWGRGNSLPYVMLSIAYPVIIIVKKLFAEKEGKRKRNLFNFFIFFALILLSCGYFYIKNWSLLSSYYAAQTATVKQQTEINFSGIRTYIRDIPGRFWCYGESKGIRIATLLTHLLMLLSLYMTFRKRRIKEEGQEEILRVISITGATIFYGILLVTSLLFNATAFYALHLFAIMLVGIIFSGFSLFGILIKNNLPDKKYVLLPLASILIILYGSYFTKKQTPLDTDTAAATPREVEKFSRDIEGILQGRSLAILWYEMYSGAIINYYRVKNNLYPLGNLYYPDDYIKYLWVPPYSPENLKNIQTALRNTFERSDYIIIPEFSDYYFKQEPYPLFQRSDDVVNYLNSPESPRFAVRMVLHDAGGIRLLLIQKEKDALRDGKPFELLKLPYGPSSSSSKSEYSSVPSDKL